jgi:methyl-accepting chemotaxis protein
MFKSIANMPISRRLLLAFASAAAIIGLIIIALGLSLISMLNAQSQSLAIIETVIALVCTIVIIAIIGHFTSKSITRPLNELSTLTRRISSGDTAARVSIPGNDEIHLIATSMNNMLDNIVQLIQETQAQRDTLQAQVEKLVSEVSGVGEGDLRVQAEVTADALGVLADSFNYMVEELGSLVVRVKTVASEVETSTNAILDRMTQLVESGDQQINHIAEAVVGVERMTGVSHQVAERTQALNEVARVARQDAHVGRASLNQVVEGMGHINANVQTTANKFQILGEHSRQINEVVEVIQAIAHQTNRLALDAAIQAAMAGENGKGFGAVAADIRRLAERSKDQASLIAQIARSIREEINAVASSMQDTQRETTADTRLTQEAGLALESIFAAVEHQAREIDSINQMSMQQLQASSAVVQLMHGVSESTQQNSISTREASQNMERLERLVEQLRASVEAFKLREDHIYYSMNMGQSDLNGQDGLASINGAMRTVTSTLQPIRPTPPPLSNPVYPLAGSNGTTWGDNGQANRRRAPF